MQTKMKLSVIIPVYNTEAWLRKCLSSVVSQQLPGLEIIIVDDGSTDGSREIIREFSAADPRIRVIEKVNEGQGVARNLAMQLAIGEYLAFVDSDDWIDEGMFNELLDIACHASTDVSMCAFKVYDAVQQRITQPDWSGIPLPGQFDGKTFNYTDVGDMLFLITPSPWHMIFRTAFVRETGAKFAEGCIYEDLVFVFTCLLNARVINYTRQPLYTYRHLRTSSSSADRGRRHFQIFSVLDQLKHKLIATGVFDRVASGFQTFSFRQYYYHYQQVDHSLQQEFWQHILQIYSELDASQKKLIRQQILPFRIGLYFGRNGMKFYHWLALLYTGLRRYRVRSVIKE